MVMKFAFPMSEVLTVLTVGKRRALIMLCLLISSAFSSLSYAGMIDKEGMQPWEICAMCHNANGISRMAKFPKLAGQKALYIEQQVMAFREGRRHNDGGQMQSIVGEIAQADVAQIAAYFSSLPQDVVRVNTEIERVNNEVGERQTQALNQGQLLFQVGREGVAACADCHVNKNSNAPWLDGQHRQYLEKQMHDFNSGDREADCSIAKPKIALQSKQLTSMSGRLNNAEIEALAVYLSTLSLPRN
ncbi:MAG: cytochrome c553 [Oleispira sp.]|jgi:cytochrome c553